MKYIVYYILMFSILITLDSQACNNSLPVSELVKALALEPNAGSKSCADLSDEECFCYDGIDFEAAVLIDEVDDLGIYTGKKLLRNSPAKKAAKEAKEQADAALETALAQAQTFRNCGERVMGLMLVRNQPKNLSVAQVSSLLNTYAPIQLQLQSGSLLTAKAAIQAVSADGVLVTEDDKLALVAQINKCLGIVD